MVRKHDAGSKANPFVYRAAKAVAASDRGVSNVVLIDEPKHPSNGQKKTERAHYSGKNEAHTLKNQLLSKINAAAFYAYAHGKGRRHYFRG